MFPATASRSATDHYRNLRKPAGDNPEAGREHLRKRKASARHRQNQS
nr:MAG TPA: hypothetical protein [Caudoviricetes sp.]